MASNNYPSSHTQCAFRVPFFNEEGIFTHFVYPESDNEFSTNGFFDLSFDSHKEALGFLKEQELEEEAEAGEWFLVSIETKVIGKFHI